MRHIVFLDHADFERLLNLPEGLVVEDVRVTAGEFQPPGLNIVIRGPGMQYCASRAPLAIEQWEDFAPRIAADSVRMAKIRARRQELGLRPEDPWPLGEEWPS